MGPAVRPGWEHVVYTSAEGAAPDERVAPSALVLGFLPTPGASPGLLNAGPSGLEFGHSEF